MVADGIHILLGVGLVAVVLRPRRVEPLLVALLGSALPDLDTVLLPALVNGGYVLGPAWTHRGVTHSVFALALFVAAAWTVGQWRAGALSYGSHVAADFVTGSQGVRLFAPLSIEQYGLYVDWVIANAAAGAFGSVALVGWLVALTLADPERLPTRVRRVVEVAASVRANPVQSRNN